MWIFSKYGFYSVVKVSEKRNPDEEYMIRARDLQQLKTLKEEANIDKPIIVTENADYAYRIVVTDEEYHRFIETIENSIDYTNFKSACARRSKNFDWLECLHNVWSVMLDLQYSSRKK